jgi:hypothetical protein
VPQSLLTLQVKSLCVEGTSMIEVVVSNDSHLPVSIDIIVDDEPRSGLVIQPVRQSFPSGMLRLDQKEPWPPPSHTTTKAKASSIPHR